MNTIKEAKIYLRGKWEDGTRCPCCNQYVRLWKKSLISSAAADLLRLVRKYNGKAPIHINEFTSQRSNFYTLSYWNLIQKANVEKDEDKRSSGLWIPTQRGIDFALGRVCVRKYVYTYDNQVIKFGGIDIYVQSALGNKFDYAELMGGYKEESISQKQNLFNQCTG